ncbi:hypothetical protein DyAD56_20195 [Dyella sp. AD56]|uniref:hypothetical protein n=1 Tax=Dyella sp. AD56 TaxID=1528744 RepID=UPI000C8294D6|nr:hypothetical protein [Dyella sp. AD56]PMQ03292.1 hypothetical protein DyAD56_20195 [Dyella sp. AD56]
MTWAAQWQWVQQFQQQISAIIGPIYVMYPPCRRIWMEVDLPTPGAFAALFSALQPLAPHLEPLTPDHDESHGAWVVAIKPWSAPAAHWPSGETDDAPLQAFRRRAYESVLPLPISPWLDSELERLRKMEFDTHWHFEARTEQSIDVLAFPSYLITNSELIALYRIAMASFEVDSGISLYAQSLIDTLNIACKRRRAWDRLETADVLNVSERLDGLIQVDGQTFRLVGSAVSPSGGASAWDNFSEQSYPDAWVIYPARAQALRH